MIKDILVVIGHNMLIHALLSSNCYSLAECKAVTHIGMKALHYVFEPVIYV